MTQDKKLNEQKIKAISALARGTTRAEAANEAGCGERSIYNWLAEPEFKQAVEEAQADYWQAVLSGLRTAALASVRYLFKVVQGNIEGDKLRVQSALGLLGHGFQLTRQLEIEDLKARLEALENK